MTSLQVSPTWFWRRRVDAVTTPMTEPHVHALLRCNIWHVRGRDRDLLVDTGLGVASVATAGYDLFADHMLVVATHAHTDHVGGLHEFAHRAIHAAEAETVANIAGTLTLDVADTDEEVFRLLAAWGYDIRGGLLTAVPADGFELDGHPRRPATPTQVLDEGDVIDLYVDSMRRLYDLPVSVVHGGHGPSMDAARSREVIRAYLDERA